MVIFESYTFLIAREHILRADSFSGECVPVKQAVFVLPFGHEMYLSRRQIFDPYMFLIARGHF